MTMRMGRGPALLRRVVAVGVFAMAPVCALAQPEAATLPAQAGKEPAAAGTEVVFPGAGGLELKGTLLLPPGKEGTRLPAVVLLPGSGPTDRDGNQKPYLVTDLLKQVAERLVADGIASLRFDKRATQGYKEKWPQGIDGMSDYFAFENFVGDALGAVKYLRERPGIDPKRVGMVGHSEGGLITLQIARDLASGPEPLKAIVLMGTAGRVLGPVVHEQVEAGLKRQGADAATTKLYMDAVGRAVESISKDATVPGDLPPGLSGIFNAAAAKLMRSYFTVDPAELAKAYAGPALIVQGEKDIQVSAERDTPRLKEALEGRGKGTVEVLVVPGASHNLKAVVGEADPGFAGPVAPAALDGTAAWVKERLAE